METLEMKEIREVLFLKHTGPWLHFISKMVLLKGQDPHRQGEDSCFPLGNVCQKHSFDYTDVSSEAKEDFTQNENIVYFWQTGKMPFCEGSNNTFVREVRNLKLIFETDSMASLIPNNHSLTVWNRAAQG